MRAKRAMSWIIGIGLVWWAILAACAPEPQATLAPRLVTLATLSAATQSASTPKTPLTGQTPTPAHATPSSENTPTSGTQYQIDATLNWASHTVQVNQQITYRNDTGRAQDTIALYVPPNAAPDQFALQRIMADDGRALRDYSLEGERLVIPLKNTLAPSSEIKLALKYYLTVPPIRNGYRWGHTGYWGYSSRQVNLGMWLPLVAAFSSDWNWVTPRFHSIGEQAVLPTADFRVKLTVQEAPNPIRVAGPGDMVRTNDDIWRFDLAGAREITLSVSDAFKTMTTTTTEGTLVELYYFPDPANDTLDTPRHALLTAADALTLYGELFGPYPYNRLVVVEGDFPDGMEFSGLVFVSSDWFRTWQGIPNDWLTLITAHEVAHQWWYLLIGNDQGHDPYIDEALAVYSEILFVEHYYPDYYDWWWDFRVRAYAPTGYVDSAVYDFDAPRPYINAVYLRGALMMQALRTDLGDKAFLAWLRRYANTLCGCIAYPADLWGALSETEYAATETTRQAFLSQGNVLLVPANDLP